MDNVSTLIIAHNAEVLVPDVSKILGPTFIGNCLNWMLMGTLFIQLYTYYQNYPNERLGLRILVYSLIALDLTQTVMLTHHGWFSLITIWGKPDQFDVLPWSAPMIPFMCGLISCIVQIFYAWRIWVLSKSHILHAVAVLIVLLALTQGLCAMLAALIGFIKYPGQKGLILMHPEYTVWLVGSLVDDLIITACMLFILSQAKQKAAWSKSETMLTRLINRMIQSGAATVIVATIDVALFVRYEENTYHFVPAYVLGKVYTNSFMLTLNLRRPHTSTSTGQTSNTLSIGMNSMRGQSGGVNVEQTTIRDTDLEAAHPDTKWEAHSTVKGEHKLHIPSAF